MVFLMYFKCIYIVSSYFRLLAFEAYFQLNFLHSNGISTGVVIIEIFWEQNENANEWENINFPSETLHFPFSDENSILNSKTSIFRWNFQIFDGKSIMKCELHRLHMTWLYNCPCLRQSSFRYSIIGKCLV